MLCRLREIVLFNNRISHLKSDDFNTTKRLESLNIAYNDLTNKNMASGCLRKLKRITNLDLTGNSLTAIPTVPA